MGDVKSFTDLHAWKEGHRLVLAVYKVTGTFPRTEVFGLSDQLRRASVSITSNIAEAYGRISQKEKLHFYLISRGSLWEVKNQIIIAKDLGYISEVDYENIQTHSVLVLRILSGLIRYSRKN